MTRLPPHCARAVGKNQGTMQIRVFVLLACAHGGHMCIARPDIRAWLSVFQPVLQERCEYRTFSALLLTDVVSCGSVSVARCFMPITQCSLTPEGLDTTKRQAPHRLKYEKCVGAMFLRNIDALLHTPITHIQVKTRSVPVHLQAEMSCAHAS